MIVREALREGTAGLAKHRCPGVFPAREAEELLAWAASVSREALFTHPESRLSAQGLQKFRAALTARRKHSPIEYITGLAPFMGRDFRVTKATLIPRPATEVLVEEVIIDARRAEQPSFVDVGTGSGAIAITLAAAFPMAQVLATDLSSSALTVARGNARRAGCADRIAFIRADLLPPSPPRGVGTNFIVANLPYIPDRAFSKLPPDVRLHEPRTALTSGSDGLAATKRLIDRVAAAKLDEATGLYFELLPGQCARVEKYALRRLPGWIASRITSSQGVAIGVKLVSQN